MVQRYYFWTIMCRLATCFWVSICTASPTGFVGCAGELRLKAFPIEDSQKFCLFFQMKFCLLLCRFTEY